MIRSIHQNQHSNTRSEGLSESAYGIEQTTQNIFSMKGYGH